MKITNIKREKDRSNVYIVTPEPNRIQRFFGIKPQERRYKDNGDVYIFGNGHVYYDINGNVLSHGNYIGQAIDAWRRKW